MIKRSHKTKNLINNAVGHITLNGNKSSNIAGRHLLDCARLQYTESIKVQGKKTLYCLKTINYYRYINSDQNMDDVFREADLEPSIN